MIEVFYIGQGETLPAYTATVRDRNGVVDLSVLGVQSVFFRLTNLSTASVVASALASIVSATLGQIQYMWATADTSVVADYAASFLFITATKKFTLPKGTVAKVVVDTGYGTE
jgi:hypothetical protein